LFSSICSANRDNLGYLLTDTDVAKGGRWPEAPLPGT
jgi:hypothetical protein